MTGLGLVLLSAAGLIVSVPGQCWTLTLRRANLQPAALFAAYHGRPIGPDEIARLLPRWRSLKWVEVPASLLRRMEMSAMDGDYQACLATDAGRMQPDEMVAAFQRFMQA